MPPTPLPFLRQAQQFAGRPAVRLGQDVTTYQQLIDRSQALARVLLAGQPDLDGARVAFLVPPSAGYVVVQWAIWQAGGVAVPLCPDHPPAALQYTLADSQAAIVVATPEYAQGLAPLAAAQSARWLALGPEAVPEAGQPKPGGAGLPTVDLARPALLLYTSGTTSQPKGVVLSHANLVAQVQTLVEAWAWSATDHILNVLPLHHVHGIVNVVGCALYAGAVCEFLPEFSPAAVFGAFLRGQVQVFMAVPTIYHKLLAHWAALGQAERAQLSARLARFRLMVSGSAALPVSVLAQWAQVSGHTLLERYGMTETGMILSNPYAGTRLPGHVGQPLPGMQVRLVGDAGELAGPSQPGQLEVKGPGVFGQYWQRPEATAQAFTPDGWFRTGDVAVLHPATGAYQLLGRSSTDIIKSGGYKVSALEIEEVLRQHPAVADCSVLGLPDPEWGERVAAVLVAPPGLSLPELDQWLRGYLPAYKLPRRYVLVGELPRNAMGKVTKPSLRHLFAQP
jgi:malonyl-CoA/methylmalonyl-CoA synthetase